MSNEKSAIWWTYDHAPTRWAIVGSFVVAWFLAIVFLFSDIVKVLAARPWWEDFIVAVATAAVPILAFLELRHSDKANRLRDEANEERRKANRLTEQNTQLSAEVDAERNRHLAQIASGSARSALPGTTFIPRKSCPTPHTARLPGSISMVGSIFSQRFQLYHAHSAALNDNFASLAANSTIPAKRLKRCALSDVKCRNFCDRNRNEGTVRGTITGTLSLYIMRPRVAGCSRAIDHDFDLRLKAGCERDEIFIAINRPPSA